MAKPRVHEIAKQLGTDSKTVIAKLTEMGEYVKSASATVEAPVIRKLKEQFPAEAEQSEPNGKQGGGKKAEKAGAAKSAKAETTTGEPAASEPAKADATAPGSATSNDKPDEQPSESTQPPAEPAATETEQAEQAADFSAAAGETAKTDDSTSRKAPAPKPGPRKPAAKESETSAKTPASKPKPAPPKPKPVPPKQGSRKSGSSPRPGNNPYASSQGMPKSRSGSDSGRPGNNPYASSQGMPRPGSAPEAGEERSGAPRPGPRPGSARSGAPRPNPGMMPGKSTVGRPGQSAGPGGSGSGPGRGKGGAGKPGAKPGAKPGGFGKGGRGRGGTQGAFGRGGGRSKGRKSKRAKRQEFEQMQAPSVGGVSVPRGDGNTPLRLRRGSSLGDFAEKINCDPASLVTVLFHLGEMATATQSLDEETMKVLGDELGYKLEIVSPEDEDRELLEEFDINLEAELEGEDESQWKPRPPVVTVMGHVDHGKTKLLDAMRSSDVVGGESGGITQHIGAYQVHLEHEDEDRALTFIDTPGHEAFTAMRARGAKVTDLAILVVAADDGVMPQTIEALNHAQAADVPIVVAVNKIDKEGANPSKVKQQLTEYNLVAEEYGGETMFVEISALQRTGIAELLEAVLLTADAALDLRANPDKSARGVAIEANLDKGRGAVATALVQSGTLHSGDAIVAGTAHGRVRAMFDEYGRSITDAGPARPVQVLGLSSVPRAGDSLLVTTEDRTARQIAEKRESANRAAELATRRKRVTLEDFTKALEEGKVETLNLVLKGDVSGAVEALEDALLKVDVSDEVALRVIHRGVGAITQNDVNLATVDNAIIIGFNVRYAERVEDLADREGVDVRFYSVIYQAIDDVESALKGMLKPVYEEVGTGSAEVRQVFRSSKVGNIAGSIVRSGTITRNSKARLTRDGVVIAEKLNIESLRRFTEDATEVRDGYECGIGLGSFNDIKEGDIVETYEMREKPRE